MLRTLIIGLGRAGRGLHLPVLRRLREARPGTWFADRPIVGVDDRGAPGGDPEPDLVVVDTPRRAVELLDPARTVVHLCTPPAVRATVLREVAALGFTRIVVEKPLAGDREALRHVLRLARERRLSLSVVAPWLHSSLTARLTELVEGGTLGEVRAASVTQHKARFRRSLANPSHTTAFDVELPHALGLLLGLLGDARVHRARCADLRLGTTVVPRMGGARLVLGHHAGVRSEVCSDLTSPVRQRRIDLDLTGGRLVGHFAVSQDDDFTRLEIVQDGRTVREILPDDSLTAFLGRVYRRHATGTDATATDLDFPLPGDPPWNPLDVLGLAVHARTVELLDDAKRAAGSDPAAGHPTEVLPTEAPRPQPPTVHEPGTREAARETTRKTTRETTRRTAREVTHHDG